MRHVSEKLVDKFINVVNNEYKKSSPSKEGELFCVIISF